jgi:hypothetical protein
MKNKSYREGNLGNLWIPSKLVIEFATQDILLILKWLNKFLENLLFSSPLYLILSILYQWEEPSHDLFASFRETQTKNWDPIWAYTSLYIGRFNFVLHVKNTWVEPCVVP